MCAFSIDFYSVTRRMNYIVFRKKKTIYGGIQWWNQVKFSQTQKYREHIVWSVRN